MILLVAGFAHAAVIVVGIDTASITEAISTASDGDTITIDGTWTECVDTAGKSLTFSGGGTIDGTGRCDNTVRIASGETVELDGLAVVNATGRAFDLEDSTVTLNAVSVTGTGRSDWSGGGLWVSGGTLTTSGCTFTGNVAYEGPAVYLYAYAAWQDAGSSYADNEAAASGGAIMAYYDNTIQLSNDTFSNNTSAGYYGGAIATWDYSDLAVSGSTFSSNTAPTAGGGAIFYYPVDSAFGVLELRSNRFEANSAIDGGAVWTGWVDTVDVRENVFQSNVGTGTGGAMLEYVGNTASYTRNRFCGNSAPTGGALSVQWTNTDTVATNTFSENTATDGGALHRYAAYAGSIVQNTFVGNVASDWGGAYNALSAYADFRNNIVAATPTGGGIYTSESYTSGYSTLEYDGFSGNAVADAAGYFYIADQVDGNVIAADPGFVVWSADGDCEDDDLRLVGSSPFKDAGDPTLFDLDGTRSDMGASGGIDQPVADADSDGFDTTTDCDDTSADAHPGAAETCNGADDDCLNGVDDDGAINLGRWYPDVDLDGFGDLTAVTRACNAPPGLIADGTDCDDADPWVHPGASDVPDDGLDADCDGMDGIQYRPIDSVGASACGCQTGGGGANWAAAWGIGVALSKRRRRNSTPPTLPEAAGRV